MVHELGPYAGDRYTEKKAQQRFTAFVVGIKNQWMASRAKMSTSRDEVDLATPLKVHLQKKRQTSVSKAQERAKVLVAEKGAPMIVQFKE